MIQFKIFPIFCRKRRKEITSLDTPEQSEEEEEEEAVVEVPPIITIPPPSRYQRSRHAVLSTSRRWFLSDPNPHFASLEFESLFIRSVELHPESTDGVLDDCYNWLRTVANREGQPPWVLLEGVTGAQGSNLRAIVGEDMHRTKCVNVLRSYREPQRLRDAKDKLDQQGLIMLHRC